MQIEDKIRKILKHGSCCGDCGIGNIVSSCKIARKKGEDWITEQLLDLIKKETLCKQ